MDTHQPLPEQHPQLNSYLIRSAIVAALGGLLFGFDTAVISGATRALTDLYHLSDFLLGVTVSSALAGTIVGAAFGAIPADRYGRRPSLIAMAMLYLASAAGCGLAPNWSALVFFRFIGGLSIGGSSVLGPMYIAEIAPARWRGRLVALFQFNIVTGILLAYFSNYAIGLFALGALEWRVKLGISGLPALFLGAMVFAIPESPRWLVKRRRVDEAREILRRTGEQNYDAAVQGIVTSIEQESDRASERLFSAKHKLPIFLAISIGMFNQLSGVNVILYYANRIFESAGFSKTSGDLQSVAIGATNFIATILAMSVIDKLGRKKLLLIGAVGTTLCLGGVGAIFITGVYQHLLVWLLVGFIGFFAFSQGAVIWVYLSEVFPTSVRAKGQSLGSLTHWFMNCLIALVFPLMTAWSTGAPFVFFCVMTMVQFFVVLFVYPETKGVTLEDMQKSFADRQ